MTAAGPRSDLDAPPPKVAVIGAALLQASALFTLWRGAEADAAFATEPLIAVPLWTAALLLPLQFMLAVGTAPMLRLVFGLGAFWLALSGCAVWTGHQMTLPNGDAAGALVQSWTLVATLLAFKALIWIQVLAAGQGADYAQLYAASWRAFFRPLQALVFLGLLAAVLWLWGALFSVIGLDFFAEFFREDWFMFPVGGFAFGVGILLFRRLSGVTDRLDAVIRSLMVLLLPLTLLLMAAFLGTLGLTGLDPLWSTGRGSALLLWLLAFVLFFANGVHQTGRVPVAWPPLLARVLAWAMVLAPVVALLAAWGVWLRIDQYGLTVLRFWAVVTTLLLGICAGAYAVRVVREGPRWSEGIGAVNVWLGGSFVVILFLANSPLLDPRSLAVGSQLARLDRGEVPAVEFDYAYLGRSLGRPGAEALNALRERFADDARVLAAMDRFGPSGQPTEAERAIFEADLRVLPEGTDLPPGVVASLVAQGVVPGAEHWVLVTDLNRDGERDFVFLQYREQYRALEAWLLLPKAVGYERYPLRTRAQRTNVEAAVEALRRGEFATLVPEYSELEIGGTRLQVW